MVSLYLWSSRSNTRRQIEGPWSAPLQLKKPFKGPRLRLGSYWEERKSMLFKCEGSLNCKSIIFSKSNQKNNWISCQTCRLPFPPQRGSPSSWAPRNRWGPCRVCLGAFPACPWPSQASGSRKTGREMRTGRQQVSENECKCVRVFPLDILITKIERRNKLKLKPLTSKPREFVFKIPKKRANFWTTLAEIRPIFQGKLFKDSFSQV